MNDSQFRSEWTEKCEAIAKEACARSATVSYEYYQGVFSASLDSYLRNVSEDVRVKVLEIARDFDYLTEDELRQQADELHADGFCHHGYELSYCGPCSESNDYDPYEFDFDDYPQASDYYIEGLFADLKIEIIDALYDDYLAVDQQITDALRPLKSAA